MSVREYIGARYVPLFADPTTWDATRTYEPLTVVLYQGNSYTSRQAVPANIDITNTTYWAQTGNYNAQIEQYRTEVQTVADSVENISDSLPATDFDSTNTVKKYVDDSVEEIEALFPATDFDSTNTVKKYVDDSIKSVKVKGGFNTVAELDFISGSVQGCTWIRGNDYIIAVSEYQSNSVDFYRWNRSSQTLTNPVRFQAYHANCVTYNPDDGYLYVTECFDYATPDTLIPTITVINYETMSFVKRVTLPLTDGAVGVYSLVYDRDEKVFYACLFRGIENGRANRIYKYNQELTEIIGHFDLKDDYTVHYPKESSSQGIAYSKNGVVYEIYYDFGVIAGFDNTTGERVFAFNIPYYANKYRFVNELEALSVDDNNSVLVYTQNGVFECGVFKSIYEDKIIAPTNASIYSRTFLTMNYTTVSELDTRTWFKRGSARTPQDVINWSVQNKIPVGIGFVYDTDPANVRHQIALVNFVGEITIGNNLATQIYIYGSKVTLYNGSMSVPTVTEYGIEGQIVARNSDIYVRNVSFTPTVSGKNAIAAIMNGTTTVDGASCTFNNNSKVSVYNGNLFAVNSGTVPHSGRTIQLTTD